MNTLLNETKESKVEKLEESTPEVQTEVVSETAQTPDNVAQQTEPQTTTNNAVETPEVKAETSSTETKVEEKLFTQAELDAIVQKRLKSVYNKLGATNGTEFDEKISNSNKELEDVKSKLFETNKSIALKDNKVDPSRYDDVDTWFKGKGKEFTAEELMEAIKTHPEWILKVTVPEVGANSQNVAQSTQDELKSKLEQALGFTLIKG